MEALMYSFIIRIFLTLILALLPSYSYAISFVRDAETEIFISDISRPILKAAGIYNQTLTVRLILDPTPNAFVIDSRHIFIHTGLLSVIPSPEALAGVIAHECGHITSHHTSLKSAQIRDLQHLAALGTALSIVVGAAAGEPIAAMGTQMGMHEALLKNMLKYDRAHETAADDAAIKYMRAAGLSVHGLAEFLRILSSEERLSGASAAGKDAYWRTHPPTHQRLNNVLQAEGHGGTFPEQLYKRFALVVAKIDGYSKSQEQVMRQYNGHDISSLYARSITLYRHGQVKDGLKVLQQLIDQRPTDPFLHELYGQILYENGRNKEAVAHYDKAIALLPANALFNIELAIALINSGASSNATAHDLKRAEKLLLAALDLEPDNSYAWQQLGIALHHQGDEAGYRLALAKAHLAVGDMDGAQRNLELARVTIAKLDKATLSKRNHLWLTDLEATLDKQYMPNQSK